MSALSQLLTQKIQRSTLGNLSDKGYRHGVGGDITNKEIQSRYHWQTRHRIPFLRNKHWKTSFANEPCKPQLSTFPGAQQHTHVLDSPSLVKYTKRPADLLWTSSSQSPCLRHADRESDGTQMIIEPLQRYSVVAAEMHFWVQTKYPDWQKVFNALQKSDLFAAGSDYR